jgi:hypothetical protein
MLSLRRGGDSGIRGKLEWRGGGRGRDRSRLRIVEALIKDLGPSSSDFCSEISGSEVERKT